MCVCVLLGHFHRQLLETVYFNKVELRPLVAQLITSVSWLTTRLTVVCELVVKHHPAVGQRRAAVPERHLDAVVDLGARHVSGDGEHVDS